MAVGGGYALRRDASSDSLRSRSASAYTAQPFTKGVVAVIRLTTCSLDGAGDRWPRQGHEMVDRAAISEFNRA